VRVPAAVAVALLSLGVLALLVHSHHFAFAVKVNGPQRVHRSFAIPPWRHPAALLPWFFGATIAVSICSDAPSLATRDGDPGRGLECGSRP